MIDLYTWTTPNGRKASILLEELGIAYRAIPVDITKDAQFAPDFLAISPNNKIPVIVDQSTDTTLMESGAILIYLAETYGPQFLPASHRLEVLEWLMWQMGGMGPMLGQAHHFLHYNKGQSDYAEDRYRSEARRLYSVLNTRLEGRAFIAGSYSIADMACWPWVSRYEWQGINLAEFPNVRRWYRELLDRPAVQRGYHQPAKMNEIPTG